MINPPIEYKDGQWVTVDVPDIACNKALFDIQQIHWSKEDIASGIPQLLFHRKANAIYRQLMLCELEEVE